jgi:hypothetical protein
MTSKPSVSHVQCNWAAQLNLQVTEIKIDESDARPFASDGSMRSGDHVAPEARHICACQVVGQAGRPLR